MTAAAHRPQLPFEQTHPLHAPPQLRQLQRRGTIHRVLTRLGHEAWLVTGYEQVRQLLGDERVGRAHPDPPNAAWAADSAMFGRPLGNYDTERADHARMRALLQPHFSAGRMRALRPRVAALATQLVDQLIARQPPVNLIEAVAEPLPISVICEVLGVPVEDRKQFRAWTDAAADMRHPARSEGGLADLTAYGRRLVARKRHHPGDDVISRLCVNSELPDAEIARLSMVLLFSGHETTVVQIGLGALHLLARPGQWQAVAADPSLVPGLVEELLRVPGKGGGGMGGIPRYARTDLEIDGVRVRAGELILLGNHAANHDPAVFADPDRIDPARAGCPHLTFGLGSYYCIGAPLARLELQVMFGQLLSRLPALALAVPAEDLRLRTDLLTSGLAELPVTWLTTSRADHRHGIGVGW